MPMQDVVIEVVEILGTGKCNYGHKVGDVYETAEEQRKICGAAYHTLYPYITGLKADGSFPWEDDPDVVTIGCPDYKNVVVFKISRKRE
ncbi:MAG: TIGR04076 family protein [Candidatus Thorarchaeota archaeon]